ncbi:hypothetical protein [Isoptericola sp. BMS4]|uniref:hypothetical protein n=1 Tax=Isoptericola sp. BMS4 TaxID=2527875 RepID=UPI001422879B|nr:hypothetical protein [Isoptericola sp. BMS4]
MTLPSDPPGVLATTTGLFLIVVVLWFPYFTAFGIFRLPRTRRALMEARTTIPGYLLRGGAATSMFLALGLAYSTSRYEEALEDLAWDAYDVWDLREYAGEALPSGAPPEGQDPGIAVVVAVAVVIAAIVYLAYYAAHGFGRVSTGRRAVWWGAALIGVIVVLVGLTALLMWHDVGMHEQAWESWFGEEIR